jgi:hypothetical protein
MHTEFWKGIAAFGVRRFGEKKPKSFRSEIHSKKLKKSGCERPTLREREQEKEKITGNNQIQFDG